MAFIISKESNERGQTKRLYYLVENYREGNKVKRKTLLALKEHRTVAEFLKSVEQEYTRLVNRLHKFKKELDDFIKYDKIPPFSFGSPFHIRKRLDFAIEQTRNEVEVYRKKIDEIKKVCSANKVY